MLGRGSETAAHAGLGPAHLGFIELQVRTRAHSEIRLSFTVLYNFKLIAVTYKSFLKPLFDKEHPVM